MRKIKFKEENDIAILEVEVDSFEWGKKLSRAFNEVCREIREEDK